MRRLACAPGRAGHPAARLAWISFAALLAWALTGGALAQSVCIDELNAVVDEHASGEDAQGEGANAALAAALLRRSVELVEPALPPRMQGAQVDADAPGGEDARWLARRDYLPDAWSGELTAARWAEMLGRFQRHYDVEPREVAGSLDAQALLQDAGAALQAVSEAVRPLALLATEEEGGRELAFRGVIWNWTPHPRFLLFRPDVRLGEGGDPAPVLERTGTCAMRPDAYLIADKETAASLFLSSEQTRMRILAAEPAGNVPELPLQVPQGEEQAYLSFDVPELEGVQRASVEFEGPGPGTFESLNLISQTRTNLNMFDFQHYLSFPP